MTAVLTAHTPPLLQGPSDKEKKYDRQLRLWAANGQQALEDAHILLLNSGSGTVGVETLKNLVLPGIGSFTIADDAVVEQADLGVNFFLDEACAGQSRAECCVRLLEELNPDVTGYAFSRGKDRTIQTLLGGQKGFTMIVYTYPIDREDLQLVEQHCLNHKIPSIAVHSAGFYSYFTLQLPGNFPIVDTHPDSTTTTDLRLLRPWPELTEFADRQTKDIDEMSAHDHGHIPFLVLLLHTLKKWEAQHDGQPPANFAEKTAFKKMVAQGARTDNPEGGEENFDEAVAAVSKNITRPAVGDAVQEVFAYKPDSIESRSSFWLITSAVHAFYQKHQVLPLPGAVPDMKAQSKIYVELQNVYKSKARADVEEVWHHLQALEDSKNVKREEVETYCKNAAFVKLVRGTATNARNLPMIAAAELSIDPEFAISPTLVPIFLALNASEGLPGQNLSGLLHKISRIAPDVVNDDRLKRAAQEVARANGAEMHNVSSLTGGMVAQEIIKVITKQYIPISNTCVFDGITSRVQVLHID